MPRVRETIDIYWDGDDMWYPGTVMQIDTSSGMAVVMYEDGGEHVENLAVESPWRWHIPPNKPPTKQQKRKRSAAQQTTQRPERSQKVLRKVDTAQQHEEWPGLREAMRMSKEMAATAKPAPSPCKSSTSKQAGTQLTNHQELVEDQEYQVQNTRIIQQFQNEQRSQRQQLREAAQHSQPDAQSRQAPSVPMSTQPLADTGGEASGDADAPASLPTSTDKLLLEASQVAGNESAAVTQGGSSGEPGGTVITVEKNVSPDTRTELAGDSCSEKNDSVVVTFDGPATHNGLTIEESKADDDRMDTDTTEAVSADDKQNDSTHRDGERSGGKDEAVIADHGEPADTEMTNNKQHDSSHRDGERSGGKDEAVIADHGEPADTEITNGKTAQSETNHTTAACATLSTVDNMQGIAAIEKAEAVAEVTQEVEQKEVAPPAPIINDGCVAMDVDTSPSPWKIADSFFA